jgi:hypothetical protein
LGFGYPTTQLLEDFIAAQMLSGCLILGTRCQSFLRQTRARFLTLDLLLDSLWHDPVRRTLTLAGWLLDPSIQGVIAFDAHRHGNAYPKAIPVDR